MIAVASIKLLVLCDMIKDKMSCNIFISWQSDEKECRKFLFKSLDSLPQLLKSIGIELIVDRDTQGLAGSPDIGDAIFNKIDSADIFIADITLINNGATCRPSPNPNVLIELGYTIKTLGWERIILINCKDYGMVESLPFDINHKRVLNYSLKDSDSDKHVASCIKETIKILFNEHKLNKNDSELNRARRILFKFINKHVDILWNLYYISLHSDAILGYTDIIVGEYHFAALEKIKPLLIDEQYEFVYKILYKLKNLADDEDYFSKVSDILISLIEPVYWEYLLEIGNMPYKQILKKDTVDILNILAAAEDQYQYVPRRILDNGAGFVSDDSHVEAYGINGECLCNGERTTKGFTGYKKGERYTGEYLNGKYHGKGKQYCNPFSCKKYIKDRIVRDGIWENGAFAEGIVFGAILIKENGKYSYISSRESDCPLSPLDGHYSVEIECMLRDGDDVYVCDMTFKNGEYDIIEGTIKKIKVEDFLG